MSGTDRNALIDAYFDSMDDEDPSIAQPVLADAFSYESLSGDLEGSEGFRQYIEEYRSLSDSEHEVTQRVHGESASIAEGAVTGTGPDNEQVNADFCNVFEFDDDDTAITRIAVYINEE